VEKVALKMTKHASIAMHQCSEISATARMTFKIIQSQQSIGSDGDSTEINSGCNIALGFSKSATKNKQLTSSDGRSKH